MVERFLGPTWRALLHSGAGIVAILFIASGLQAQIFGHHSKAEKDAQPAAQRAEEHCRSCADTNDYRRIGKLTLAKRMFHKYNNLTCKYRWPDANA